jgi:hypothetical protein
LGKIDRIRMIFHAIKILKTNSIYDHDTTT